MFEGIVEYVTAIDQVKLNAVLGSTNGAATSVHASIQLGVNRTYLAETCCKR